MAGIALTGIASGLDTQSLVSQLVQADSAGRTRLTLRQAAEQARSDGLKDIQSKLSALKTAADALKSAGTWSPTQSAESADPTKVAVRMTGAGAPGGFSVLVTALAKADQHGYSWPGSSPSQLTLRNADSSVRSTISLSPGATIDDAVTAINADTNAGVIAVNAGGKLLVASKETGAAKQFTIDELTATEDATLRQTGADADVTIGGQRYTPSSNVVSGALAGVELTLKATGTTSVSVSFPATDKDAVKAAVKTFTEKYNDVVDAIRTRTTEKRDPTATTATNAKKGALFNDVGLNGILGQLRSTISGLEGLGISTGSATATVNQDSVAGKLVYDPVKLTAALDANAGSVQTTLAGATTGFADRLLAVVTPLTQADGVMAGRVSSSSASLSTLKTQLERFDDRLATKQAQYEKMFARLETALARSQSLQAEMQSRLSAFG